ncbi:RNA-binding S4 domain-containing protein [Ideonella livida]|uniref:RNA-binding S4 domain-containing protein n=1 Tax=Ideonella livida TaxID=2707176 RepID=A0A7C9PFE1_9BURK|nr:RNA-binding S4 domain-containing protein [Ideonella livida]NDY90557.1 RNA-binding S4 domain-containing protein [Ideonella livida]
MSRQPAEQSLPPAPRWVDHPVRLDKWLWAARFFKTRSLAVQAIDKGRLEVNGQAAKASRDLKPGDRITWRDPGMPARELEVLGLSDIRGPAPVAQQLYRETAASLQAREAAKEQRRQGVEPAATLTHGRPTKKDRRELAQWDRWSVSIDPS